MVLIPSELVPGPAPVAVEVPEGWTIHPAPGITAVVLAPEHEGHFRPNAVLTHARLGADADLAGLAAAARAALADLDGFQGQPDRTIEHDGRPTVVREYAFVDRQSGLGLYQLQLQTLLPVGLGVADLLTLSGTCSGGQLQFVEVLRGIAMSLQSPPPSAGQR